VGADVVGRNVLGLGVGSLNIVGFDTAMGLDVVGLDVENFVVGELVGPADGLAD